MSTSLHRLKVMLKNYRLQLLNFLHRDEFRYSVAVYLGVLGTAVFAFVCRYKLTTEEVGWLTVVSTAFVYLDFCHFGIRFGIDKIIPTESDQQKIRQSFEVTHSAIIFLSIFSCLLALLFLAAHLPKIIFNYFAIPTILSYPLYAASNFSKTFARAEGNLKRMIFFALGFNLTTFLFKLAGLFSFGLNGIGVGTLIGTILFVSLYTTSFQIFSVFSRESLVNLYGFLKAGFPTFCNDSMTVILTSTDKWVVLYLLGPSGLGQYSTAAMLAGFIWLLAGTCSELTMRHVFTIQLMSNKQKSTFFSKITKLTAILTAICLAYSVLIYLCMDFAFPDYSNAKSAAVILSVSTPFIFIRSLTSLTLIAINKWGLSILISLLLLAVQITILGFFSKTLNSVAIAILATNALAIVFIPFVSKLTYTSTNE